MNQHKSAKIISVIFALIICLLISNILYLGITGKHFVSGEDIETFAKNRSKKQETIYAKRGQIYTSDQEKVAVNVKKYKIILVLSSSRPGYGKKQAYVSDAVDTARKLAPILSMDETELTNKIQEKLSAGKYQMELGSYGNNLTATQKKQIEDLHLNGIEFEESDSRYYPLGDFCSYVVGYAKNYEDNSIKKMVGEMGLELVYDKSLKGENGFKVYQTDAKGYALVDGMLRKKDATNGQDMYLTLNSGLQRDLDYMMSKAYQETHAQVATCAVMEVKTGKILAMSSYPSFNPNERNISTYNNFFLEGTMECGSVFKPFIYTDSINEGKYSHSATYVSGRYNVNYNGKTIATIKDHNGGEGWGTITYDEGLMRSSNVAICNLLDNGFVTKDVLKEKLKELGFFQASKMDGLDCSSSIAMYDRTDNRLEYLTTGFGQGSTVTPYQLLKAYSIFGNDGRTVEPYVVDRIVDSSTNKVIKQGKTKRSDQIFSSDAVNQVKELMLGVVENEVGTGKRYRLDDGTQIFGKTGTGQVPENGGYSTSIYMNSFVGLAPYDDPQVEIVITFKSDNSYVDYVPNIVKTMTTEALNVVNQYKVKDSGHLDESYTLDSYTNQSVNYVKSKLESKSLKVQLIGNGGTIIEQYPIKKTKVSVGDRIFLKTDGKDITVPNMSGWSKKEVLTYGSLSGIEITFEGSSGQVTGQSVAENSVVHSGDKITVNLSN
ncbi:MULTISPECIES: penicillin-binding protein [Coprobacillaceae]|uniref:penicillin-binding protein n=1 Tax=Coprobacillaceae TaxID=2810280 RepID=UPI000E528F64|nr:MULTISPECIES: penicillin-binding protein [Coprobacillaceae]RHM60606.1 penicillin-binding protein [Coprobacillus sp. AF33-1AC]RHS93288.1 penicillin-binding protein [Erysipelatoclostridium sp. AM42-17]